MVMPMQEQNVKICKGPGCKAWSSDRIARELLEISEALDLNEVRVCRVPCMKVCGGGASIRVNGKRKIVKMKEAEEVLGALGISVAAALAQPA
jgi:NADH:ubiquinone oxidoreductase subunit E